MNRQSDLDNHANQLNSNNDAYWESRGFDERPDDWEEPSPEEGPDQLQKSEKGAEKQSRS